MIVRNLLSWNARCRRRALFGKSAVILMYHGVAGRQDSHTNAFGKHVFVERFREQIEFFASNYNIISLEELTIALRSNRLVKDSLVITFDDGYHNAYSVAYPILKEYGIPATVFLVTGLIGTGHWAWMDKVEYLLFNTPIRKLGLASLNLSLNLDNLTQRREAVVKLKNMLKSCQEGEKVSTIQELEDKSHVDCAHPMENYEFLNWDEVAEMSRNKVSFGAHTVNHPILSRCDFEKAQYEILDSKKTIEAKLGREITTFCYPNGKHEDYIPQIKDFCRKHFDCAVTANLGTVPAIGFDLYELYRIGLDSELRFSSLLLPSTGLVNTYHWLQKRFGKLGQFHPKTRVENAVQLDQNMKSIRPKREEGARLRAVVFGNGLGTFPPLLDRYHQEFNIVAVFQRPHMPMIYKWLFLALSFHLPKSAWRRRWYHYIEKTPFSFLTLTRLSAKQLDPLAGQYDLLLFHGALHAPSFSIERPLFILTDSTRSLSSRNPHDEVSHFRNDDERQNWLALEGSVYRAATRIFVGSQFVKNSLVSDYGLPSERVIVTGFGAGLGHAGAYEKRFDSRTVLFIGKGDFEKKGGLVLLQAFELVRRQIPDATLHIVGQEHLPSMPGVVNHGFIMDRAVLRDLMKAAHTFVLPSLVDRNPITILEAMAAATPCISSDYGAIPELLGNAGIIVPCNDAKGLAAAIVKVLTDPTLAHQLGQNGRQRFEQKYNWDSVWAQIKSEIYKSIEEDSKAD